MHRLPTRQDARRDDVPAGFAENINYGFRRNLWATKVIGIMLTLAGVLGSTGRIIWNLYHQQTAQPLAVAGVGAGGLLLVLWIARFTPAWGGDAYAERLLECLERLEPRLPLSQTTIVIQ